MRSTFFRRVAVLAAAAAPFVPAAGAASDLPPVGALTVPARIGVNVEGVVDYSVAQPFVDAMRQARPWGSPARPYDEAVAQAGHLDRNGWPTVDAGVLILCCVAADGRAANPGTASELSGTYALSFTGKAQVTIPIFAGTVAGYAYDAKTNTSSARVTYADTGAGTALYLSFTGTRRTPASPAGSGVSDVHLIRPQYAPSGKRWWTDPAQRFTDPFLATLSGYSALRFMDWSATNNSPIAAWAERTTGTYATAQRQVFFQGSWQSAGASWEDAIALANATNEDMWINVPARATDDYVTQLARLIRATLRPGLHVYVEYSNEVWNGIFSQFQYNLGLAEAAAKVDPAYAAYCSPSDRYRWGQCHVAARLAEIAATFAGVDGWAAIGTTVRPVFATQEDQTYDLGGALYFISKKYGPPARYFYGIAQAPYWEGDQTLANQSVLQELEGAETSLRATVPSSTGDFTAYAVQYGLHNLTYEGGPGMSGTPSLPAKIAANLDPRIGGQVTEALTDFFTRGGDLFVYYNDTSAYGQYGMWGTTPDVFDRATPKIAAIHALEGAAQTRDVGSAVPGTLAATAYQFQAAPGGYAQPAYYYFRSGAALAYLVEARAAGTYRLTLRVASYATAAGQATILRDGRSAGTLVTPPTGGNPNAPVTTAALAVALPQGLSVLEVAETRGEFALYGVALAK